MRIEAIDGLAARCHAKGVWREVSLLFMQDPLPEVGDYVMVNLGMAMQRVGADEAQAAWALYEDMLAQLGDPP